MKNQTFIFAHDQKIIIDFINGEKFKNLDNLKYVFLGLGETNLIETLNNVIIAKDHINNIEKWNKTLIAYTGWFLLYKNNLIESDYVNLFEYDINIKDNFQNILYETIENNKEIDSISYIPISVHDYMFFNDEKTSKNLLNSIEKNYKINAKDYIRKFDINTTVGVTSNQTLKKETFNKFIEWMEPIIEDIKEDNMAGHYPERALPFFILLNNLNKIILENILKHFQLDSHKTQGIYESKKHMYKNLLN